MVLFYRFWYYGLGRQCDYGLVRISPVMKGPEKGMTEFVALNVTCFHCFDWVMMVPICAVVVLLCKLQKRMPSLSLAAYDIRTGWLLCL